MSSCRHAFAAKFGHTGADEKVSEEEGELLTAHAHDRVGCFSLVESDV